jgi:hypothetical protein
MKAELNKIKLFLISISFVAVLSACDLLSTPGTPTQSSVDAAVNVNLQSNPTQTEIAIFTPVFTSTIAATQPISTPAPPNTPVWSIYKYTCVLADGGGTVTMNLAWTDHSNSEDGYKVYRDGKVIATLAANTTSYVDTAFIAAGKTFIYSIEAFNKDWRVSTSTITYGCQ